MFFKTSYMYLSGWSAEMKKRKRGKNYLYYIMSILKKIEHKIYSICVAYLHVELVGLGSLNPVQAEAFLIKPDLQKSEVDSCYILLLRMMCRPTF